MPASYHSVKKSSNSSPDGNGGEDEGNDDDDNNNGSSNSSEPPYHFVDLTPYTQIIGEVGIKCECRDGIFRRGLGLISQSI